MILSRYIKFCTFIGITVLLNAGMCNVIAAAETAGEQTENEQKKQKTEKQVEELGDITVQATRVDKSLYEIPASVGFVNKDDIQYGRQQLGLDESLNKIPGLFMQNRYNFNQDLSISIRGFGIADFGIRGVKIYVDGIPNTLPDGQGGIDTIDIGSTDHMEVIRGPSSSLYGSASGGVINIYTEDGPLDGPFAEGRATMGSYNFKQLQVKTGGQYGNLNYLASIQRLNYEGFRPHSKIERTLLNSKFRYDFDATSDLTVVANILDKPIADDPGSLTRAEYQADRHQARASAITFDAEETVEQQQVGLVYRKSFNEHHETTVRNYYVFRDFNNKLPFPNAVAFDRFFTGGGLQHSYTDTFSGHKNRLTAGFDIDSQMDHRKNFVNSLGTIGALSLDQDEDVFSWGVYLQNEFNITDNLQLTFGARYDEVEFDFSYNFLSDGNDSGVISFDAWSPQAGLLWSANEALNLYGNISTSFETPTSTEFATPDGSGGFNQGLSAQTATNYEIGVKGLLPGTVTYQLSLFKIDISDELLPAGENINGSVFFNNAGESTRNGVEAGLSFSPLSGLNISFAYTYSDFEFDTFTDEKANDFSGNSIPGVPEHFGYMEIAYYHPSGTYAVFDGQAVDEVPVDNANSDAAEGYAVANFRMGHDFLIGNTGISTFIGINNIFDKEYIGNVRINAGGGRFFEAAPELNVYAGLSLNFH